MHHASSPQQSMIGRVDEFFLRCYVLPCYSQVLDQSARWLDGVSRLGQKMEVVLLGEGRICYELSLVAYYLKQMTEYGADPNLDKDIMLTSQHVEEVVKLQHSSLDRQTKRALTPVQYLGRYVDTFRASVTQRDVAVRYKSEGLVDALSMRVACGSTYT
jgi:hypothetical protein